MREAQKEPQGLPDDRCLRASLGLWGIGEAA
jgi:hypothetical protein